MDWQTDTVEPDCRQTVIQSVRQADRLTYRHTDIQTYNHNRQNVQTYRHTDRETGTDRQAGRQAGR